MENEPSTTAIFEQARPMLMGLAYRTLGSIAEAEDVVQDTYLAWMATDSASILRPRSWLTTVCTRKAIDALRSARLSRTNYVGAWLPEPVQTRFFEAPESDRDLSGSLTTAFLLVLERLAPKERAAFLLREVFSLPYEDVAASLEISQPACRKLVSRARAHVRRHRSASDIPRPRQDELVAAFGQAIRTGDTARLAKLLASDATLRADSGGKAIAIRHPLEGAEGILGFVERVLSPAWQGGELEIAEFNSAKALILRESGKATAIVSFSFNDEHQAAAIFIMRNPDKLARIDSDASGRASQRGLSHIY